MSFESPKMKGAEMSHNESKEEKTVTEYMHNLGLTAQEINGKKVLDVGAGSGEFVRFVNKNGGNAIGLDNGNTLDDAIFANLEKTKTPFVLAEAYEIPFEDTSFDLVVSHSAIPNIASRNFKKIGYRKERNIAEAEEQQRRLDSLKEMLRVVTEEGEIRCAPVVGDLVELKNQSLKIRESINKIKEYADVIEEPISATSFRLILKKKKN